MSRSARTMTLAALSLLWCGIAASAETLRCQSVNGNLNCAGSGGVSCQTVDGRKVCVSGHGDVVQSFGGRSRGGQSVGDDKSFGDDTSLGDDKSLGDDPSLGAGFPPDAGLAAGPPRRGAKAPGQWLSIEHE